MINLAFGAVEFEMDFDIGDMSEREKLITQAKIDKRLEQKLADLVAEKVGKFITRKKVADAVIFRCNQSEPNNLSSVKFRVVIKQKKSLFNWLCTLFWLPTLLMSEISFRRNLLVPVAIDFGLFLAEQTLCISKEADKSQEKTEKL